VDADADDDHGRVRMPAPHSGRVNCNRDVDETERASSLYNCGTLEVNRGQTQAACLMEKCSRVRHVYAQLARLSGPVAARVAEHSLRFRSLTI
jgi:hypothetical protein